ncbi:MAG: type II toxin-antitoxin system RelE/ParE family toxin [Methylophilaceae bacterium]
MAEVIFSEDAIQDIYRLTYFLLESYPEVAFDTGAIITNGLQVLANHPLVGAKAAEGLRRLIISRGRSGYIALYDYDPLNDRVMVLGIKHQRELDFS